MLAARRRAEWDRVAWLAHIIVNTNPWRDGPPVTPGECNPLVIEAQPVAAATGGGIDMLDPDNVRQYHEALLIREQRRNR